MSSICNLQTKEKKQMSSPLRLTAILAVKKKKKNFPGIALLLNLHSQLIIVPREVTVPGYNKLGRLFRVMAQDPTGPDLQSY